jgi:hypothetical protein
MVMATALFVAAPASGSPHAASVVLSSGEIVGDSWSASVEREQGAAREGRVAELQPCVGINSKRIGGGNAGEACTFRSRLTPESGPVWITTSQPNQTESETAMTAVAMVFAPVTASAKATLVDGRVETIGLRRLTSDQARTAGLARLRYAAFATAGTWCLARLESFDRAGHLLWRSSNPRGRSCSPGE